jgi:uncharacterized iron-regulated membrane protein
LDGTGRAEAATASDAKVATWLALAGFLIVVGLTGSLLAFNTELERLFAPQLFAPTRPGETPLDLAALAEKAEAAAPEARIVSVTYYEPDQVLVSCEPRRDKGSGARDAADFDELYLDPWTGAELGRRRRGDLSQGRVNLMPFFYDLHWRLALGDWGQWILGACALLWTLDCFVAFVLTLPLTTASFWRRWKPAWLVKRGAGFYRLNLDLHRAGGLWLWVMLFVFAWSSVMMDWRAVYEPVMSALFDYRPDAEAWNALPQKSVERPALDWRAALAQGQRLMADEAKTRSFAVGEAQALLYAADTNSYVYSVHGSRDLFERSPKGGSTMAVFDADSGALVLLSQPTGEHAGNTLESWLYALHMARVFGMPYRIFVCLLGVAIAILSVTGVYIWWKKRRTRRISAASRMSRMGKGTV